MISRCGPRTRMAVLMQEIASTYPACTQPSESRVHGRLRAWKEAAAKAELDESESKTVKPQPKLDVNEEYDARNACVLQTLIGIRRTVLGCNSAHDLHNLFWSDPRYAQYRQYSDDSVILALLHDQRVGMQEVKPKPGTVVKTLAEQLPPGEYAVIVAHSGKSQKGEDHMVWLRVDKNGQGKFWQYAQLGHHGLQEATNLDKNATIRYVFR